MRVMMVCTGNICRSAMAESVMKDYLREHDVTGIEVASCGISDEEHGNPIDRRAAKVLREHGYTVPNSHHARQIQPRDFQDYDLFLAMTSHHYDAVERLLQRVGGDAQVQMYREYDQLPEGATAARRRDLDVPDPWYGGMEDFEDTLAVIERVTPRLVSQLI